MAIYHWYGRDFKPPKDKPKKQTPKLIHTRILTSDGQRGCTLQYRDGSVTVTGIDKLDPQAAGYAVYRYIKHCPQLRDRLIPQAVRLGLRDKSRSYALTTRTTTAALGVGGDDLVFIRLILAPGTVTIDSVSGQLR